MAKEKYGFVYIWYDRKHKRYYIGCHWGHVNDRYVCSSRWMRQAYKRRPHDFKRRILATNISTREQTITEETKWLSLIHETELGKRYYNVINKGYAHWSHDELERRRISKISSIRNRGKRNSPRTEFKPGERRSAQTEFKIGMTPHNKGKQLEDVVGTERAQEIKRQKSQKLKGKSFSPSTQFKKGKRTGTSNPKARAITTPFGGFDTITEAVDQTGITLASIMYKLRSSTNPEWTYT